MNSIVEYSQDQLALLKRTIAADATNDEFALFVGQCKRTGLDPFTRQIYFIKDARGKVTVCASIDGLRLVAERSGVYEGQTPTQWCGEDGVWKDVWTGKDLPFAARVGVWKNKFREPTYGVAIFDEYAGRKANGELTFMWNKMPALMIGKVAEALALRKAFPNDLSGIYSSEEGDTIETANTKTAPSSYNQAPRIEPKLAAANGPVKDAVEVKPGGQHQTPKTDSGTLPVQADANGSGSSTQTISGEQVTAILNRLKVLNKEGQRFYDWLNAEYGTRNLMALTHAQYNSIMDILGGE